MNFSFIDIIASIISAIIGSMGLGGGGVLIMYLTLIKNVPQIYAQGMNLLFFIPCSIVSLFIYMKSKMIKLGTVLPMIIGGIIGVFIGNAVLKGIDHSILSLIFSIFLIVMGVYTVFSKSKC